MRSLMQGRLVDLSIGLNRKQRVTIELDRDFRQMYDVLKDSEVDVDIKKHRDRRSTNANNYLWHLLDEMGDVLERTKESLYFDYIKKCGPFKNFTLSEDEAKTFRVAWSRLGTGYPTEQVGYSPDGEKLIIRAYYGSSQYNTKQMSRLIDLVVQDAKELGIETLTPAELARMKQDWRCDL